MNGAPRNIHDFYYLGERLSPNSKGSNGEVVLGVRKTDCQQFAVKIVRLGAHTRESRSQIRALKCVNHVGIIKLIDWFEGMEEGTGFVLLYMVMELAKGGDFLDHLVRCADRRMSEVRTDT